MFSGFNKFSTVPSGKAAKASLVGANTIKGPAFTKAFSRDAACTAATKVVWSGEPMAMLNTVGVLSSSVINACPVFLFAVVSASVTSEFVEASLVSFLHAANANKQNTHIKICLSVFIYLGF